MSKTTRESLLAAQGRWSGEFRRLNKALLSPESRARNPVSRPGKPKSGLPAQKSPLAAKFETFWAALKGPALTPEFRFHPKRKWRFDYCIPARKIAIELEGGILSRKGHGSPKQFVSDCNKYNAAAMDGWLLLRLGTGMVTAPAVAEIAAFCRRKILENNG